MVSQFPELCFIGTIGAEWDSSIADDSPLDYVLFAAEHGKIERK
jgi:hypothetical protein